jgi:hypothetical protein
MCHFSFINVVCEILNSICVLYKYILYLSHGKAKEKRERRKKGVFPECQMPRHSGMAKFKKQEGAFPECLGIWHSGKGKLKKRQGPSPSAWAPGTRGRAN